MPDNIEIPHTGNKAVDWAVHSAFINLATKVMIFFIGLSIPAMGWVYSELRTAEQKTIHESLQDIKDSALRRNASNDIKLDRIAESLIDIKVLQRDLDALQHVVLNGFDAQGRRIDKNEKDLEALRKEMYDRYVPPGTSLGRPR